MSVADGSLESILGGVSEQTPMARVSGQLAVQTNMLSDVVTGLRRRPGTKYRTHTEGRVASRLHVKTFYVEAGGTFYTVVLNSATGALLLYDKDYNLVSETQSSYLVAPGGVRTLRTTTHAGDIYVLNPMHQCTLGSPDPSKINPDSTGFYYIRTGAFNKKYTVKISSLGDAVFEYTTPAGTTPEEVAFATPEAIAAQLANLIRLHPLAPTTLSNVDNSGAYVYISTVSGFPLKITSDSGQQYIICSNTMQVNQLSDLPATLTANANGIVCAVGLSEQAYSYFRWDYTRNLWKETSSYDSAATISNAPLRVVIENNAISAFQITFEGRVSGNDTNNPYPRFMTGETAMTGIFSYQGRLGILAHTFINLSGSGEPQRFMRSTTTDVLQNDPIETGSGGLTSANFEYAVPYNKDLLIFASTHQAIITPGNTPISPTNCIVSVMSRVSVDTVTSPTQVGKSLLYSTLLTSNQSGFGEFVPSSYSSSNYSPQNLTDHLPTYFKGNIDTIAGSLPNNMGIMLSTGNTSSIFVYEYIWKGDDRTVAAWHKWDFPTEVIAAHFAREALVVTLSDNAGGFIICDLNPRKSPYLTPGDSEPYIDIIGSFNVVNGQLNVPSWLTSIPTDTYRLTNTDPALYNEPVGIESISNGVITTVRSFQNGSVRLGVKFNSVVELSPPLIKSPEGVVINQGKVTLLRYLITLQNSGAFKVDVASTAINPDSSTSPVTWGSGDLKLNKAQNALLDTVIIPVRALAYPSKVSIYTDDVREMNLLTVEYTLKFLQRRSRL